MTTGKTTAPDTTNWLVLLPTGETVWWDGVTMPIKLGKHMIAATDGRLVNPDQVVTLTPPTAA